MFEVAIDRKDIQEIEDRMDKFTSYLVNNYTNVGAVALILDAVLKRIKEVKEQMEDNEDEQNEEDI